MDLALFFRVLWRFRAIVALGVVAAILLTTLSIATVSFAGGTPHLKYRQKEQWQSFTTMIVSPPGFPWGKTTASPTYDPAVYASLAQIYANLANSDAVKRRLVYRYHVRKVAIDARVVPAGDSTSAPPLPLLTMAATGTTQRNAVSGAEAATRAFLDFFHERQAANEIPHKERVNVTEIEHANAPTLLKGRSKTTPVAVFLAVVLAFIGLAFVLENLRPRVRVVSSAPDATRDRQSKRNIA